MAKQEAMTQDPTNTQEHDSPGASPPADGPPARPARGLRGWFGGLSRIRKLILTWSASVLAVVIALLAIGATSGGTPKHAPAPRAPAFTLAQLGHAGQHISLAQYAGHPLILNFFASWCEPCQRETPLIARFYRGHRRSVIIVGIDVNDSTAAGLAFARKMGVAYPVASDPSPMSHGAVVRGDGAAADVLPQPAAPHRQAGDPRGHPDRPAPRDSPHDQAERTELS